MYDVNGCNCDWQLGPVGVGDLAPPTNKIPPSFMSESALRRRIGVTGLRVLVARFSAIQMYERRLALLCLDPSDATQAIASLRA